MSKMFRTWPQFCRSESVAARRLYQGILLFTWWGTCTLMSWHRNSTLQSIRGLSDRSTHTQQTSAIFSSPRHTASKSIWHAHASDGIETPGTRLRQDRQGVSIAATLGKRRHTWRRHQTVRTSGGSRSGLFLRAVPWRRSTRRRA